VATSLTWFMPARPPAEQNPPPYVYQPPDDLQSATYTPGGARVMLTRFWWQSIICKRTKLMEPRRQFRIGSLLRSFMARLFRMLVVATMAVHLTMGCCWHHTHGCEGSNALASPGHCTTLGGLCCCDCDHSDHGSYGCNEPRCSFVPSNRLVRNVFAPGAHVQTLFTAVLDGQSSAKWIGFSQRFSTVDRFLPPVRPHLANQVLLI
jgi:hypothetical protein